MRDGTTLGRRHLLAGLAGAGLVGAGVLGADALGGDGDRLPVRVRTLEAAGSASGERSVPTPGTPTVIDCFATWCGPCAEQMSSLRGVHDRFGDDVSFVSVTNERFGAGFAAEDVRSWWREHDGRWTLGHDPESDLLAALGGNGLPYLAVTDRTGAVTWRHGGVASAATLADRIEAARR